MKKIFFVLLLSISVNLQAEGLFENINQPAQGQQDPQLQQAHRLMSLLARLSVYSLMCDRSNAGAVSERYRAIFTESSGGKVSFEGLVFTNPIETLRNKFMRVFTSRLSSDPESICNEYRSKYDTLIEMTPEEMQSFVELDDSAQQKLLPK